MFHVQKAHPLGCFPDAERMKKLCSTPFDIAPETRYEQLNSIACQWYITRDDTHLAQQLHLLTADMTPEPLDIFSLADRPAYLLYTGGKDSFVAREMLKAAGIKYKTVTFNFGGREMFDKTDIRLDTKVIQEIDGDWRVREKYGKNIPIHYFMFLQMAQAFPNSNIFVGNEYLDLLHKVTLMYVPYQTDVLLRDFNAVNNGAGINGCKFYSPCCNIPEFHVYRLARVLGFERKFSEEDMYEKRFRYNVYEQVAELLKGHEYFRYTLNGVLKFDGGVDLHVERYSIDVTRYVKVFIEEILTYYQSHGQNFQCHTVRYDDR